MVRTLSIVEAKARFSDCVREAESGGPIFISRHGRVVAALVRPAEVAQLQRLRRAGARSGLASLAGGWKGSDQLADLLQHERRRGSRPLPRPR